MARWPVAALFLLALAGLPSAASAARAKHPANVRHGVKAVVKHRTLTITGSRKANSVTLRRKGARLLVDVKSNGSADFKFKLKSFRRIVVNGGRGKDTLVFTGTGAADTIGVSRKGRTARITGGFAKASAAAVRRPSLSARAVENLRVRPGDGPDSVTIGDLSRTGVKAATVQLGADNAADTVGVTGTIQDDVLTAAGGPAEIALTGLRVPLRVTALDPVDRLALNGSAGADTLHLAGSLGGDVIGLSPAGPLLHAELNSAVVESDDVELVRLEPLAGQDSLTVQDLGGTDVSQVAADLGITPGGLPDGQVDSLTINGGGGADTAAVSGGPAGVIVSGLSAGNSMLAPDPVDRLTVNGLGGADSLSASGFTPGTSALSLRGGADNDALTGSPGDDTFGWDPGDGVDTIEGGGGSDTAAVAGTDVDETFTVAPNGGRVSVEGPAGVILDMDDVETANFAPRGGADVVEVPNALPGTDLTAVGADFGADGQVDEVFVQGTNGVDNFHVAPSGAGAAVTGAGLKATGATGEPGIDILTISALVDNDTIDASALPAGVIGLVALGSLGNDNFFGSQGNDLFLGGDGNDLAIMGAGDDTTAWSPGDDLDTIEGQDGTDLLQFTGNGATESFDLSDNGGRLRLFRDVASVTMDCNDVERVDLNAREGSDTVTVHDLTGTDLTQLNVNLQASTGAPDAFVDNVLLNGTGGADHITLGGGPSPVTATGLSTTLTVTGGDASDKLNVLAGAGDDTINAAGVAAGSPLLTLQGDDNNDTITGSFHVDNLLGGAGNDTIFFTPGDTVDGGTGTNTILPQS